LQDYGRALIVGDSSTHGKGTVQSLIRLEPYVPKRVENPGAIKLTIRKFYRASGGSTQLKGVIPDIVLPSPNNYAEIGEASLDNPLPWDPVPSASYKKLNLIQPVLPELQRRSSKRLETDQDFIYLREDIDQYRKLLADKTVSLNEEQRLKEKQEKETRDKTRQAEMKARPEPNEKVYDITLKQAEMPGLPAPVSHTNELASAKAPHATATPGGTNDSAAAEQKVAAKDDDDDADAVTEPKVPVVDAAMKEAKRILADLVTLWSRGGAVAQTN
jgi:carboxyl-terminal processing protease